jgi:primosomal replication protein N
VWQEEIIKISPDGVEMCKTIVQFRLKSPEKRREAREANRNIFKIRGHRVEQTLQRHERTNVAMAKALQIKTHSPDRLGVITTELLLQETREK